jgi:hypothetical protein
MILKNWVGVKRLVSKLRKPRRNISIEPVPNGFSILADSPQEVIAEIHWDEISKVLAYKRDCFIYDQICFAVEIAEGKAFEICEDMEGWENLILSIPQKLPGFPEKQQWFQKVAFPAFKTNVTTLFERLL